MRSHMPVVDFSHDLSNHIIESAYEIYAQGFYECSSYLSSCSDLKTVPFALSRLSYSRIIVPFGVLLNCIKSRR